MVKEKPNMVVATNKKLAISEIKVRLEMFSIKYP